MASQWDEVWEMVTQGIHGDDLSLYAARDKLLESGASDDQVRSFACWVKAVREWDASARDHEDEQDGDNMDEWWQDRPDVIYSVIAEMYELVSPQLAGEAVAGDDMPW